MGAVIALDEARRYRIAPRVPWFAPVAASGLGRAWISNLSAGGLGITGFLASALDGRGAGLEPGDDLELGFALGEPREDLRVVGRVAWMGVVGPDGRVGLGVQFRDLPARARAAIGAALAEHRPRVLVALAGAAEREVARRALADLTLAYLDHVSDLEEPLLRSCAAVVAFPSEPRQLEAFLDLVGRHARTSVVPGELPLPAITLCTAIHLDHIVPLFEDGKAYEVFRPPFERRALASAVARSCRHWATQLELRWASLQLEGIAQRRAPPPARAPELPSSAGTVIRASPALQRVHELVCTVAVHDVPVLLTGETGTGKEVTAREIHARSRRAHTPFVAQDCGALTETLLESELFGHVRGAFTGAFADHPGLFQAADGGTIFLDEIQNTSPALQAKLLRVVEQGEVRPVGGQKARRVDVRLIAACNVDLRAAIKGQQFRADFYYRLNRFPIELPPLRAHVEDILPLTRYFVKTLSEQLGRPLARVEPRAEAALVAYDWPGNIRELRNAIERALLLTPPGDPLRWEVLPDDVRGRDAGEAALGLDAQVEAFERRVVQTALERSGGVIARAARELQVNPVTLARRMRRLGLLGA
jgi:DNA-binding NtrC family response regulator/Tfp pilus assembly protein PilZ